VKTDLTSYFLQLKHQQYQLKQDKKRLSDEINPILVKLNQTSDPEEKMFLEQKYYPLSKRLSEVDGELANIDDLFLRIESYDTKDKVFGEHYQKIMDREDIVISIAVALLSICVIFMITVSPDFKTDYLNYFIVSRFVFAAGIGALVIRVFLDTRMWNQTN
jgi:hypothetical protein